MSKFYQNLIEIIAKGLQNNTLSMKNECIKFIESDYKITNQQQDFKKSIKDLLKSQSTKLQYDNESNTQNHILLNPISIEEIKVLKYPQPIQHKLNKIIHHFKPELMNRLLFFGETGTGKTEACKYLAKQMNRTLYTVNMSNIIDSKLGGSLKNLTSLFKQISSITKYEKAIVLFDEVDTISMNRLNNNDLREMGRVTSEFLKLLDIYQNPNTLLIFTTNLKSDMDLALVRRLGLPIEFNGYTQDINKELVIDKIKEFKQSIPNLKINEADIKTFLEDIDLSNLPPYEIELKIKESLAFHDENEPYLESLRTMFWTKKRKE